MEPKNAAFCSTDMSDPQIISSFSLQATGSTALNGSFGTILYRQVIGAGFTLRHYHCFIDKACELTCLVNEQNPFICVNLKHTVVFDFNNSHQHTFYEWACNVLFQPVPNGKVIFHKAGQYSFFTIHFGLRQIVDYLPGCLYAHSFAHSVCKNQAATLCIDNISADKEMRNTISDILYNDRQYSLQGSWLEIRSKELLLPFFMLSGAERVAIHAIDEREAEAIYRVKEKLSVELHTNHRLQELANYANLSEYKLKSGFRRIYNMSLLNFLHEVRMKKAYELIAFTELPYYEVASRVGYKSVTTFGNLFKRKMGISPRRLRISMQGRQVS
jgi:AraC-like DNA-binding protein